MEFLLLGVIVGFPVVALATMSAYAYLDAGRHGMSPEKWALVSFFVPFFGFFAYLFERDERTEDPEDKSDQFVDGPFEIHESRARDAPFSPDSVETEPREDSEEQ